MQQKTTKLRVLTLKSLVVVSDKLLEQELYASHNKELGRKVAYGIYHIARGSVENPQIKTVVNITEALEKIVNERYPKLKEHFDYLNLVNPQCWKELWLEYGCNFEEFGEFVKGYDLNPNTMQSFVNKKKTPNPPRFNTIKLVSAYFLMAEQQYKEKQKYKVAKMVNRNPLGAKLQLKQLRTEKFWKDQNESKN